MFPIIYLKLAVLQAHICMPTSGTCFSLFTLHMSKTSVLQKTYWFIIECNSARWSHGSGGFSPRRRAFDLRRIHVGFVMEKWHCGTGFSSSTSFSLRVLVTIITPVLYTLYLFIYHKSYKILAIGRILNHLTPNGHYMGRTAQLTSRCCILYIYSTNIRTEYFKHAA